MKGIIYFLTNEAMPGLIKVGYTTTSMNERLKQLNSTGVPTPFDVAASFLVTNPDKVEKEIHQLLESYRPNKDREFFQISMNEALLKVIDLIINSIVGESLKTNEIDVSHQVPHDLSEETVLLLKALIDSRAQQAEYDAYSMCDINGESEVQTISRLADLKALGFVEEKKHRESWKDNTWKITSKGIKFIFDNNLVEDYMLKAPYF